MKREVGVVVTGLEMRTKTADNSPHKGDPWNIGHHLNLWLGIVLYCIRLLNKPTEHNLRLHSCTVVQCLLEMSGSVFCNPTPYHSKRFVSISNPRFSLVLFPFPFHSHCLFPFPPAPIPIRVDIFCQFIAALLLIVF